LLDKKLRVYNKILDKIKKSTNICLITHISPDLDTICSALAFYQFINEKYNNKKIDIFCAEEIPNKFNFIKKINLFQKTLNPYIYDLIIFFDISSPERSWLDKTFPKLFNKTTFNTLNIDHHISNTLYSKQNIVNIIGSSTTMIIMDFLITLNIKISNITSNYILTWIFSDTWWLKHSNVDQNTYNAISILLTKWANLNLIVDNIFKKNELSTIKLWWKILSNSFIEKNILYAYVNKTDLDSCDTNYEDINWVIDYLNMIQEADYTTLLTQKWEYIKWSLRTLREDIDLSKIAKKFNWWGHKKASWFSIEWKIELNQSIKLI